MNDQWYSLAQPDEPLTQGDLIFSCPISSWHEEAPPEWTDTEELTSTQEVFLADVILMTQACDLMNEKLRNVILCPAQPVSQFKEDWQKTMENRGQNPNERAWKKFLEQISKGHHWNYAIINSFESEVLSTELRVVDFHEVYTLPQKFLEAFIHQNSKPRLQLLSPYREHLSQSFARFFMRVGLPTPVKLE